MTDARLVATNPETSELVPVAVNAQGQLKTEPGKIELIDNDLTITGDLIVGGTINGEEGGGGGGGSGLPEPLGTEGQIIQIVDGEPVWITNERVPLPSAARISVKNGTTDPAQGQGMFDDNGALVTQAINWDEYARTLQCWTIQNPAIQTGISLSGNYNMAVDFQVQVAAGDVIEFKNTARGAKSGANSTYYGMVTATTDHPEQFVTLTEGLMYRCTGTGENCWDVGYIQLLCEQDYMGPLQVVFRNNGSGVSPISQNCQRWEVISGTEAVLRNQQRLTKEVNRLRSQMQSLSEVSSTTDIDQLRLS